jgi:hypothetical protein
MSYQCGSSSSCSAPAEPSCDAMVRVREDCSGKLGSLVSDSSLAALLSPMVACLPTPYCGCFRSSGWVRQDQIAHCAVQPPSTTTMEPVM